MREPSLRVKRCALDSPPRSPRWSGCPRRPRLRAHARSNGAERAWLASSSSRGQQVRDHTRIREIIESEDRIAELVDLSSRQRVLREVVELGHDIRVRSELTFTASGCIDAALHPRAVAKSHLDANRMPKFPSSRRDRWIVANLDFLRERDALRIGDLVFGELVDETVAFNQIGCDGVWQVELGGREPPRDILPARMI